MQYVLNFIKLQAYMISIDFKDVFYSVPMTAYFIKYLGCYVNECLKLTFTVDCRFLQNYQSTIFYSSNAGKYISSDWK